MARKKQEKVDYTGKSIKDVLSDIKKIHGKDSIRLMDQEDNDGEVEVISTGSMWVDSALGINGLPRGRVVEILGPESGGKTTLALHCVSEAQKAGGVALYIDAEHAMDMSFAKKIGVNASKFVLCQPDSGEQALDILEKAVSSGKFAIAVVDSVSALVPQAEIDGSVGDSHMGLQARLMGQGLRKITSAVSKTKTLVIFINQIRMKIGVMFGSPETTSGGQALKFFSSIRIDIRRIGALKEKERVIGNKVRVKIIKNKLASPYKEIETDLIFGYGFSKEAELLQMADDLEVVDIHGSTYSFGKTVIGRGRLIAVAALQKNKDLFDNILAEVRIQQASGKVSKKEQENDDEA